MKGYKKNDMTSPMASEPGAVYSRLSTEHHAVESMEAELSRKGRMTVDEFCNMLHRYVDEYYDSIQG